MGFPTPDLFSPPPPPLKTAMCNNVIRAIDNLMHNTLPEKGDNVQKQQTLRCARSQKPPEAVSEVVKSFGGSINVGVCSPLYFPSLGRNPV